MGLIRLEFAYENDTYYCENLMKLSLDQYLEMDLIQTHGFSTVSFITKNPNEDSFEWKQRRNSTVKTEKFQNRLFSGYAGLLKDFKKTLSDTKKQEAIVLRLEDFCELLKKKDFCDELNQLRNTGTIVLKCSPLVEDIRNVFSRDCPLLKCDAVLRECVESNEHDFFKALYDKKNGACRFLNVFSEEHVRNMLLHLVTEDPDRCKGKKAFEMTLSFLYHYLNNEQMQHWFKLFPEAQQDVLITHRFEKLYLALQNKKVWNQMQSKIEELASAHKDGLDGFLKANNYRIWDNRCCIFLAFGMQNVFSRFLMTYIRSWVPQDEEQRKEDDNMAAQACSQLRKMSITHETPTLLKPFEHLLTAFSNHDAQYDFRSRLMKLMRLCIEAIYTQNEDAVLTLTHLIRLTFSYIDGSAVRDDLQCSKKAFEKKLNVPDEDVQLFAYTHITSVNSELIGINEGLKQIDLECDKMIVDLNNKKSISAVMQEYERDLQLIEKELQEKTDTVNEGNQPDSSDSSDPQKPSQQVTKPAQDEADSDEALEEAKALMKYMNTSRQIPGTQ